jgi:predicted enzyme related to lactoylglutathione lyase
VLDAGRVAAIGDPTGAVVSLWQPRARAGAELVNETGALCWNELATTDIERATSFFGQLLGWEYETDDSGYVAVMNAGRLNGGMREQTEQERRVPPGRRPPGRSIRGLRRRNRSMSAHRRRRTIGWWLSVFNACIGTTNAAFGLRDGALEALGNDA